MTATPRRKRVRFAELEQPPTPSPPWLRPKRTDAVSFFGYDRGHSLELEARAEDEMDDEEDEISGRVPPPRMREIYPSRSELARAEEAAEEAEVSELVQFLLGDDQPVKAEAEVAERQAQTHETDAQPDDDDEMPSISEFLPCTEQPPSPVQGLRRPLPALSVHSSAADTASKAVGGGDAAAVAVIEQMLLSPLALALPDIAALRLAAQKGHDAYHRIRSHSRSSKLGLIRKLRDVQVDAIPESPCESSFTSQARASARSSLERSTGSTGVGGDEATQVGEEAATGKTNLIKANLEAFREASRWRAAVCRAQLAATV